ncbi:UNVERIFIED_CONTAM: hypothetical protein PYX00_010794 [Menopon gallinae]|uniref:CCHC-type domain-containing protein n=1 Tax=Menopon gallinae TaxID=328185 RepID=A0AAW2HGW6_9NEOP
MRQGRSGVIITTADETSWTKVVNHKNLKDKGLKTTEPGKRWPRLGIYGMDRSLEKDQLTDVIYKQNFAESYDTLAKFKEDFSPLYRTGRRDNIRGAWVVRVTGGLRKKMLEMGRVYIGWDVCRVEDEPGMTRCYRCLAFGHLAGKCVAKPVCGHCGTEGHERKDCGKTTEPAVCGNCKRFGRPAGHDVASRDCPYYLRQLDLLARITDYGC